MGNSAILGTFQCVPQRQPPGYLPIRVSRDNCGQSGSERGDLGAALSKSNQSTPPNPTLAGGPHSVSCIVQRPTYCHMPWTCPAARRHTRRSPTVPAAARLAAPFGAKRELCLWHHDRPPGGYRTTTTAGTQLDAPYHARIHLRSPQNTIGLTWSRSKTCGKY